MNYCMKYLNFIKEKIIQLGITAYTTKQNGFRLNEVFKSMKISIECFFVNLNNHLKYMNIYKVILQIKVQKY